MVILRLILPALAGLLLTGPGRAAQQIIPAEFTSNGVGGWVRTTAAAVRGMINANFTELYARPSGGTGSVTSFSLTSANGVSGSVATATTTPALTVTLGAITPSSVTASGVVTGSNLTGTNTGDNAVNSLYSGLVSNATHSGDVTGSGVLTLVNIPVLSGANLTTLNASNFSSGTVPADRLGSAGGAGKYLRYDNTWQTLAGGGDAVVAGTLDQFADVTQTAGQTLAITSSTTLSGGTHSGTNTGDNSANTTYASDYRAANFVAGTHYLAPNGSAAALTSFPTLNQNTTGSAATLTTPRTINGTSFDGSGNITVTASADTLTGATLPALSGVNLTGTATGLTAGNSTQWTTGRTVATTGDVTYTSGSLNGSANVTGTATLVNIPVAATYNTSLTEQPLNNGGWSVYRVSGSDATTTGQALVDITGLVSGTLANSTLYEIEAVLRCTTTAVTTGIQYGINGGGTGAVATCNVLVNGTTTVNAGTTTTISAIDTASAAFITTASASGTVILRGWVTTRSTGTATIAIRHLKVTSGTSTIRIGSILRVRKAT